mmetsp:Transcript_139102/g.443910  ORF Transcript_139102/g.443910 Transcript_139102/m.443910 type:complete len:246 (-) Transcript_139102:105-842(-)
MRVALRTGSTGSVYSRSSSTWALCFLPTMPHHPGARWWNDSSGCVGSFWWQVVRIARPSRRSCPGPLASWARRSRRGSRRGWICTARFGHGGGRLWASLPRITTGPSTHAAPCSKAAARTGPSRRGDAAARWSRLRENLSRGCSTRTSRSGRPRGECCSYSSPPPSSSVGVCRSRSHVASASGASGAGRRIPTPSRRCPSAARPTPASARHSVWTSSAPCPRHRRRRLRRHKGGWPRCSVCATIV